MFNLIYIRLNYERQLQAENHRIRTFGPDPSAKRCPGTTGAGSENGSEQHVPTFAYFSRGPSIRTAQPPPREQDSDTASGKQVRTCLFFPFLIIFLSLFIFHFYIIYLFLFIFYFFLWFMFCIFIFLFFSFSFFIPCIILFLFSFSALCAYYYFYFLCFLPFFSFSFLFFSYCFLWYFMLFFDVYIIYM